MAEFLDERSARLIASLFDLDELEAHAESVYAIDRRGTLLYVNTAWHRFARDNLGAPAVPVTWSVGANFFDAIPEPLKTFYRELFARAPRFGESLEPASFCYECSSAERFRRYNMLVYSLPDDDAGEPAGHLVLNSLLEERPHDRDPHPPQREHYLDPHGIVHQCAHCRRVNNQGYRHSGRVPGWVEAPPRNASHGLCPVCFDYFFSAA